ncbi:TadE/TadG family type IV pilus assembly protein [Dactylosporangium sp. CS-033363]|uniref:TadE/TadG family type IV pilus assembly protein n=1 Tax=Dactylosporangium sp. CS-033363 TaxID=3239935 RepID=UPI003D8ABB5F
MTTPRRPGRPDHESGRWGGVGLLPKPGNRHGAATVRAQSRDERGAAAVELAIVLPVLLLIIFGIIDFGRAYNQRLILTEAAREGARAEAVGASASQQVTNVVNSRFAYTMALTQCQTGATPSSAKVVLTATYTSVTPIGNIVKLFGGTISWNQMTATGVMTCVG